MASELYFLSLKYLAYHFGKTSVSTGVWYHQSAGYYSLLYLLWRKTKSQITFWWHWWLSQQANGAVLLHHGWLHGFSWRYSQKSNFKILGAWRNFQVETEEKIFFNKKHFHQKFFVKTFLLINFFLVKNCFVNLKKNDHRLIWSI